MNSTNEAEAEVDVAVVGGGPAGLSAALVLGRACKKVHLFDAGPRRNQKAEGIHGFVTRDGIPPEEFRAIARAQLQPYDVTHRNERVLSIRPDGDGFHVEPEGGGAVRARRIILAMGLIDEPMDVPGMREVWGRSAFQCVHCHGWENRGLRWGVWVTAAPMVDYAVMLKGWTRNIVAFAHPTFELPADARKRLSDEGVELEPRPIRRLLFEGEGKLRGVEVQDGTVRPIDLLYTTPKQHLPPLVTSLGLAVDEMGFVRVDEKQGTSMPGVFAAGDMTSFAQAALLSAAGGARAAYALIHGLNLHPELHAR